MPALRWWHVMLGTYASWLPGDRRGFRNRDHRIHSSGDYRNPPPEHEHEGLREYNERRAGDAVDIPLPARQRLAELIARLLREAGYRVLVVSVSQRHVHFLAELPADLPEFNRVLAWLKVTSSRLIKDVLPGRVWSRGDNHVRVRTEDQKADTFAYLLERQGAEPRIPAPLRQPWIPALPHRWCFNFVDNSICGCIRRVRR